MNGLTPHASVVRTITREDGSVVEELSNGKTVTYSRDAWEDVSEYRARAARLFGAAEQYAHALSYAPAPSRTGQLSPMQYAQAIGLAYLAAPHGSDEESELHRALGAACDRLGLDVAEILCGLKEQHGESITVEDAS